MAKDFTLEMFESASINEVRIGGTVDNKRVSEGKERMNKEGEILYSPDGGVMRWDDSYYVEFSFKGGVSNFKVSKELFDSVEIDKRYQFVGRAFMKTPYGEGQPYISIEPIKFDFLF